MAKDVSVRNLNEVSDSRLTTGQLLVYVDNELKKVDVTKVVSDSLVSAEGLVTQINDTNKESNAHFPSVAAAVAYIEQELGELKKDILGDDLEETFNTLKAVQDWADKHGTEYASLLEEVESKASEADLNSKYGELNQAISDLRTSLNDYLQEDDLADYVTKTELDDPENGYVKISVFNTLQESYNSLSQQYGELAQTVAELQEKLDKVPSFDGISDGVLYGLLGGAEASTWEQICGSEESIFTVPTPSTGSGE